MFDCPSRIGGTTPTASTNTCVVINSNNVVLDNNWLWRADHGGNTSWIGWTINPSLTGIEVNGENMTAYGLFVEHHQKFQTMWNANGGRVYFYESELPYDAPNNMVWSQNGEDGYPSYKVAEDVTTNAGTGMTVATLLYNAVRCNNTYEKPNVTGINMTHLAILWLLGNSSAGIDHIINSIGGPVNGRTNVSIPTSYYLGG